MKLVPFEVISSGCNAFVVPFQQFLEGPMEVLLCERVNDLRHSLFHLLNCLITTASELRETKSHREQGLDYREAEQLSWCPSWSNSLWQGWSCGLVYFPGGNATDPISRVLASSDGISSRTPLKPQYSNPNPNSLANQLWSIDFLTPPTPLIIPHRLPAFLESLMPLNNWCSIHATWTKSSLKHSIRFCGIFPSLKQNFIAYCSSKVSDCIFEIHQLWQSGFSWVYSNCCCSFSFEPDVSHLIRCIAITYWIFKSLHFKCLKQKRQETYWKHHVL